MKQIQKTATIKQTKATQAYFKENCVFFDIETTGFSPKSSFVYLIGMAVKTEDGNVAITQFLAENRSEEAALLCAFHEQLRTADTLITFNGLTFDIPFLKAREAVHAIDGRWDDFKYLDLYKITAKLSQLFQLPDKKQKSLEQFLGIWREDAMSGGELISVYHQYEKFPAPQEESLLLMHNYEDVLGMTELLSILAYRDFFASRANISQAAVTPDGSGLLLTLQASIEFPKHVLRRCPLYDLMLEGASAKLLVPIYSGELKYYYDNFKDYYYLPEEDIAIHKSVAAFVDPSHRKKATAATCYTKKSGLFLPQNKPLITPCFCKEARKGVSYFELSDSFFTDSELQTRYADHLLQMFEA